jgi:hypothetical protein
MEKEKSENKMSNFVGFIPKPLRLEDKPALVVFPFNVMIGRYTVKNNKLVLGYVLYEPDLSSLIIDEKGDLIMVYHNRFDIRYYLKISIIENNKTRKCEKYREKTIIGMSYGVIDWDNQDKSWNNFFQHVAFIGLDNGEKCIFSEV